MPPFRKGPIEVDRHFTGEALHELRDIGHGHRINIVDASYNIPRGARVIDYPGSSAEAFMGVVRLIPIENDFALIMDRDEKFQRDDPQGERTSGQAGRAFVEAASTLDSEGLDLELEWAYKDSESGPTCLENSFYYEANFARNRTFIKTIDDLPFACASLVVGHSQRTG